jgi:hypothetical protein
LTSATALLDVSTAYRLCILPDATIERLFNAVIEANQEDPSRRFFGGLTFLEGMEEDATPYNSGPRPEAAHWLTASIERLFSRAGGGEG